MKALKKFIALLCAAVMLMSFPVAISYADDDIDVYLNDGWIEFEDQRPVIIDGRTLVPLRAVFEAMGADVRWYSAWNGIDIYCADDVKLNLVINQRSLKKTGGFSGSETIQMDVAPQIINDRTMIPLRAVSEAMGAEVNWDGDMRIIDIYYSDNDIERNKEAKRERTKFYSMYPDVLNFENYIETEAYESSYGTYKYDYSEVYGDISQIIYDYVDDMQSNGYALKSDYTIDNDQHVTMSGTNWDVEVIDRFLDNEIWVTVFKTLGGSSSSSTKSSESYTPASTPEPTQAPAFRYLNELGTKVAYKDSDRHTIAVNNKNGLKFTLYLSTKLNPGIDKNKESQLGSEFKLNGEYSRLTGSMVAGNGTGKIALRFFLDGDSEPVFETAMLGNSAVDLNLDVSDCDLLRIEAYGLVGTATSPSVNLNDAKLWYE